MIHLIRTRLRATPVGKWLLDESPRRARILDFPTRWMPRRLALLLKQTEGSEDFLAECRAALSYYSGGDFIDVGAHEGSYSLILANKSQPNARFHAFEPHLAYYHRLQANMAAIAEMYPNIRPASFCAAVGDGRGIEITFPMGETYHPQVRCSDRDTGPKSVDLDSYVNAMGLQPAFIKIDVEGAEYFVLRGAQKTLAHHQPVVMLEFHPQFQPSDVAPDACSAIMKGAGYTLAATIADEAAERQFWLPNQELTRSQIDWRPWAPLTWKWVCTTQPRSHPDTADRRRFAPMA